jgi:flagellar basal body-associated protein FliL
MSTIGGINMNSKAQGLPINTIILIVIAIVVLAAVLLFFFTGFGKPSGTLSEQQALSNCQSKCSVIASSNPTSAATAATLANSQNFCTTFKVGAQDKVCTDYTTCYISSVPCAISCSGGTATCV